MLALQFAALATCDPDRVAAFAAFEAEGLPTRRNEAWHYTDLRSAMTEAAPLAPAPDARRIEAARALLATRERIGDVRFVMVDGRYAAELSDRAPAGLMASLLVEIGSCGAERRRRRPERCFRPRRPYLAVGRRNRAGRAAGNRAFREFRRAAVGLFARRDHIGRRRARAHSSRSFFGAGAGAQRNALTTISLGEGAKCALTSLIDDDASLHLESQIATLAADAELDAFALVAGGGLVRRQIFVRHDEPGAKIALGGLSLLQGKRHADTTLVVEHAAPRGKSREYYRHIVADEATGVYQGKVIVEPHAQKTDGGMKSQAILLSPTATMNNKPELEIFADDVVCGHGATVGALDPEQLFYLPGARPSARRSRSDAARGVRRRRDRPRRRRRNRRGAARAHARMARGAWLNERRRRREPDRQKPADGVLRRRGDPRGFSDPGGAPLRQAARLSRQRRLGAEAARRPRPARRISTSTNTPTSIGACTISPMPRPTPTRRRARACAAFSTPARSRRSCSRVRRPRRSTSSPRALGLTGIGEGDEIVLSVMEHHANIVPWHFHRERKGAVLKWVDVADDGSLFVGSVRARLDPAHQDRRDHADVERARARRRR